MKVRMRNTLSIALVIAMLVSVIVGCTGNPTPTASSATTAATTNPAGTTAAATTASSTTGPVAVKQMKMFVDETWWPYKEWKGRIPDLCTSITGVKPIVTVAADSNALSLLIASGNMGDLIVASNFVRLSNANTCYDIDALAKKYNIDISGIHSVMKFVNTADDGKCYTQFCGYSPDNIMKEKNALIEGRGMVVRTDILDKIGVKESDINSIADLESVLAKVKTAYPGVVPFAYNVSHDNAFMKTLCGAIKDDTGFIDVNGKLYAFLADPNMKTYYMLINKWYRLGYMTDENFAWVTDSADAEYMIAGKLFADSFYGNTAEAWNQNQLKKAGVSFTVTQLINIYNQPGAAAIERVPGWRGLFIPKSCSDPALALKFCLWAWSQEGQHLLLWGEEGKDWNWSADKTYPKLNYDFQTPVEADGMKYWGWIDHDGYANTAPEKSKESPTLRVMQQLTKIAKFNPVLGMIRINADSEQNTIMNNLIQLEKTSRVKIISAKTEADAVTQYNLMIDTANKMGMQSLVDWATPLYQKNADAYNAIKGNTK